MFNKILQNYLLIFILYCVIFLNFKTENLFAQLYK
jgi:hypothetical protein